MFCLPVISSCTILLAVLLSVVDDLPRHLLYSKVDLFFFDIFHFWLTQHNPRI